VSRVAVRAFSEPPQRTLPMMSHMAWFVISGSRVSIRMSRHRRGYCLSRKQMVLRKFEANTAPTRITLVRWTRPQSRAAMCTCSGTSPRIGWPRCVRDGQQQKPSGMHDSDRHSAEPPWHRRRQAPPHPLLPQSVHLYRMDPQFTSHYQDRKNVRG